jgi:hypothetical protein
MYLDFLSEGYHSVCSTEWLLRYRLNESCKLVAALEFPHHKLQAKCDWLKLQHQVLFHADSKPRNILAFNVTVRQQEFGESLNVA